MRCDQKTVAFGIVGCGMIANFHARAIAKIKNATLLGVSDKNKEAAECFAKNYNIRCYRSYEEMLGDKNIDAVCICTPSSFHAENAIAALEAGKHVAVEKPMAFTAEQTEKIEEAVKKSGKLLTSIAQLRFSDDIVKTKQLIESGSLGTLTLCDLYMKYWRSEKYYASSDWKGTREFDGGGALMNQGIHGIDALIYLLGEATVMQSVNRTLYHDIEVEDTSVSILEFKNGAYGVIEATTCAYPGFERKIEINGTKGCVILRENKIEKLVMNGETIINDISENVVSTSSDPTAMSDQFHKRQLENLVDAICGKNKLMIDVNEGAKAVKLIEDIYNKGR